MLRARYGRSIARFGESVRQPYFAYDHTSPGSEGLRTVDDSELFNGPPDRFEWELLGKREMIVSLQRLSAARRRRLR